MCLCHMPMQSHALTTTKIRYCYDSDSFDELIRLKHCLNCFGLFSSQKRFVAEAELILNELLDPCKLMNPSERKCPTLKRRARNPERKKSKPVFVLSAAALVSATKAAAAGECDEGGSRSCSARVLVYIFDLLVFQ